MQTNRFSVRLLGGFEVVRGRRSVTEGCRVKMRALLAYLAVESGRMHSRQALAGLLWPECDEDHARQSLRQALAGLRHALGDDEGPGALITVSRESVGFNGSGHDLDTAAFEAPIPEICPTSLRERAECRNCHLAAIAHYRGPFLAGLSCPDAPEFEAWLELKRERFERHAAQLLGHLAACHEHSAESNVALLFAREQLRIDPWHEPAHRQVMRLLAFGGARNAALAHYRRLRHLLAEELGVEPEEATRALAAAVRAGRVEQPLMSPAQRLAVCSPWDPHPCAAAPAGHGGERRVLTVLSVELRCAVQSDPERLHARLGDWGSAVRQVVQRHGGAVCEQGALDLTAYFGLPEPCERGALQAVRAALALRSLAGRPDLRCRVHTGIVFVPPRVRSECGPDFSVVGAVPRVARRLHEAMPDADIAVSASAFALVKDAVECGPHARLRIADSPELLAVHEICALRDRALPKAGPLAPIDSGALPFTVREGAEQTLERLGSAKALAQLAAYLGEEFREAHLARLLELTGHLGRAVRALADDLERLVSAGVLEQCPPGDRYRFAHAALRRAALRSQSRAQRRICRRLLDGLSEPPGTGR